MKDKVFVIVGAVIIWIGVFALVVYAASQGVRVNIAHAFIFANVSVCLWFVSCAMANLKHPTQ